MNAIRLSQDIRPVTDLKAHGAELVRQVTVEGRPVVLSRHGRAVRRSTAARMNVKVSANRGSAVM